MPLIVSPIMKITADFNGRSIAREDFQVFGLAMGK